MGAACGYGQDSHSLNPTAPAPNADTGAPRSEDTTPFKDPAAGLYPGPYGGPREGGCFL